MANVTLRDLPQGTTPAPEDQFVYNDDGVDKRITRSDFEDSLDVTNSSLDSSTGTQTGKGALDSRVVYFDTVADRDAAGPFITGQHVEVDGATFKWDGAAWINLSGFVTPEMYGATDSDTDDNADPLINSAAAAEGLTWRLKRAKYSTSKQITVPNCHVDCTAGACEIDGSLITSADAPNFTILLFGNGGETALPNLGANLSAGDNVVDFASAHNLSEGDYFFIYNPTDSSFSGFRTTYRAGEWCRVIEVNSTTQVTVAAPLYADYLIADVDLYKPDMTSYSFSGSLSTKSDGNDFAILGIRFSRVADTDISNVKSVVTTGSTAISVDQCIDLSGTGLVGRQLQDSGGGTDYGLSISNCQDCTFDGVFSAFRHGVTHGGGSGPGATPCRNIRVYGTAQTSGSSSSVLAFDWHGNCEYCYFEGIALGGVNPAGDHNTFRGTVIDNGSGILAYCTEWLGHDFDFSGTRFISRNDVVATSRGCFDIGGGQVTIDSNTTRGGVVNLSNTTWDVPNVTQVGIVSWRNRGASPSAEMAINLNGAVFVNTSSSLVDLMRIELFAGGSNLSYLNLAGVRADRSHSYNITALNTINGPSEKGAQGIMLDTGAAFVTQNVSFNREFPAVPSVVAGMNHDTDGTHSLVASAISVTTTGFTLVIATGDRTNFAAAIARNVSWHAESPTVV